MATSPTKVNSNRANAQKSTGPRTVEGKRAASLNALRHGLTAQVVVLPSEDMEAYRAFTSTFVEDLQPVGILETQLAQTMSDTQWRSNRFRALEASLFALGHEQNAPLLDLGDAPGAESIQTALAAAKSLQDNIDVLRTLSLHEQRLNRTFQATYKQLRETQALRRQQLSQELYNATEICKVMKQKGQTFHPADFGFVSSNAQLEIGMRRRAALSDHFDGTMPRETPEIHNISVVHA